MKRSVVLGLAALLLATIPSPGAAQMRPALTARLHGRPIALERVGHLYCHDLDYPLLRCFASATRLDADVQRRTQAVIHKPRGSSISAVSYVRIYEHEQFTGASALLSASYDNLGDIGWNDRITSFKSVNSGLGTFFHNANYVGAAYSFCCNQNVGNVGASYNDTFSSVDGSA